MRLTTIDPLPIENVQGWLALSAALTDGRPARVSSLEAVEDELHTLLPDAAVDQLRSAVLDEDWACSAEVFCRSRDREVNVLIGPHRAFDHADLQPGSLILKRDDVGRGIVADVSQSLERLGSRLFGRPLTFGDRLVEFYDVAFGTGPIVDAGTAAIALFPPWCQLDESEADQLSPLRRTVLLTNVVAARSEERTLPIAGERLCLDGSPPQACNLGRAQLRQCISLWLTLHELLHANGPQPLFDDGTAKSAAGSAYAAVEEFRVDATAWLLLRTHADLLGPLAEPTADLILAERLCRSATAPVSKTGQTAWGQADRRHGELWLSAALRDTPAAISDGVLAVEREVLQRHVVALLDAIYHAETLTVASGASGRDELSAVAQRLQRDVDADGVERFRAVVGQTMPSPGRIRLVPGISRWTPEQPATPDSMQPETLSSR